MNSHQSSPRKVQRLTGRVAQLTIVAAAIVSNLMLDAHAAESCVPAAARVVSVQGGVELRRAKQAGWQPALLDEALCSGDQVRVLEHSRAALRLNNESVLRLDQKTTLTVNVPQEEKASLLDLLSGAIHVLTRTPRPFRIRTPFVNAGVEGTEFLVGVDQGGARLVVYEGRVAAANDQGSILLASGESATVEKDSAPRRELTVKPEDAVQWALYYPTIFDYRLRDKVSGEPAESALAASIELYRQGGLPEAIRHLANIPEDARTSRVLTYRAGLLLLAGRVDEALPDLERALKLDPRNSDVYALRAIIAVVQNDKTRGLALATEAVALDSASPSARIALSYAQQAHSQIEPALVSVQKAVELDAHNALAWARAAELEMSTGNLDPALAAAQRATALNPDLAKTQSVLGFAHLTRIDTSAARAAFNKAIELDQSDPLPRLGRGLAMIREGELEAGRVELEIAAGLDPANSLIRSYLGKAYYEEKRDELAGTQFDLAKQRDPRDPTPWFYDAIRKQTENRPVEALRDMEKSIALNDNRAVYRSRLLLDQDLATRATSLAGIYNDLGFEQLALVEAAKSLSLDPSNHSSHRFLSDTYATLPRHEIARASELLQAQLFQPININPVQPHRSVTDLNILRSLGPAESAFNEFTPLFERNRPQLTASGMAGNNGTLGDEVVVSGIQDRFSYSLGQFHYRTDGFRDNNDIRHNIYNLFAQFAATPNFNLQAELRQRETRNGDLQLRFDPSAFSSRDRHHVDQDTARIGARYSVSPQSTIVGSLIYTERDSGQKTFQAIGPFDITIDEAVRDRGYQAEAQYVYRARSFNLTAGAGRYQFDARRNTDFTFLDEVFPTRTDFKRERDNGYVYARAAYPHSLLWTFGVAYDALKEGEFVTREWSPKLGLQWDLTDAVRLRLAAFQMIKPPLVVEQTIEPTEIAGFNQFFDDVNGSKSKRYGLGLDIRPRPDFSFGAEVSRRDIDFPVFDTETLEATLRNSREALVRAYVYWIPHSRWALSGEYRREKFEGGQEIGDLPIEVKTTSFPLSIRYFHPGGLFAAFGATYINQDVTRLPTSSLRDGRDDFVVLDAAIGYRLPNRRGVIRLEARNLLDKRFLFQDANFQTSTASNPILIPERTIWARVSLNF